MAWNKDERTGYRVWLAILHQVVPGSRLRWPPVSVADQWQTALCDRVPTLALRLSLGRDGILVQ